MDRIREMAMTESPIVMVVVVVIVIGFESLSWSRRVGIMNSTPFPTRHNEQREVSKQLVLTSKNREGEGMSTERQSDCLKFQITIVVTNKPWPSTNGQRLE